MFTFSDLCIGMLKVSQGKSIHLIVFIGIPAVLPINYLDCGGKSLICPATVQAGGT